MSLNTKEIPGTPLPKDEAHVTQAYETPSHRVVERDRWSSGRARSPQRPLGHFLHNLTCLLVYGSSDLHHLWEETSHGYNYNNEAWESTRDSIVKKLKHINIVAGLFLTAILAFTTTEPPDNGRLLPYTMTGPYFLILWSAGATFACLSVGLFLVLLLDGAGVQWFHETLMSSQPRFWATAVILLFPIISLTIASNVLVFGLFIAATHSEITVVRYCFWMTTVPPWLCVLVFYWMLFTRRRTWE